MRKWIGYLGFGAILVLILNLFTPIRAAIQQSAGLAVAETATKWNNIKDAAVGDNLTTGILVGGTYLFDGTNWDRARGDITYGLDVDVTRMPAVVGNKTPSDAYANPTDHVGTWSLSGVFDGTNWRRWLLSIHGDNLTTATGGNVAAFGYGYDGTNWDRLKAGVTNADDVAVDATGGFLGVRGLGYVFDGTNWDRIRGGADNSANPTMGKISVLNSRANAAAPTWTENYQVPLSVDLSGNLRTLAGQSGTWTVQPGNTANTTAWLVTGAGGTFPVTGTFWQATQPVSGTFWQATQPVSGTAADNSVNSTTKLPILGGRANAAAPTWTEDYQVPLSVDLSGRLRALISGTATIVGDKTPADTYANPTDAVSSWSLLGLFDGTNWQRARSNVAPAPPGNQVIGNSYTVNTVLLASGARTANGDSGALIGYGNFRSGIIQLDVTAQAGTTPTLDVYIDTTTDGTNWINIAHFAQFGAATGRKAIQLSENTAGGTADFDATADLAAGTIRQGPWGSTISIRWVITGTTPSYTFSVTGTFKS